MKLTPRIIGLSLLLLFLWLFNSYRYGDFQSVHSKESMAQMDARFPDMPQTEYNDKTEQLEIDLEKYEQTVNAVNDTIRERIRVQQHILDDTQIKLRPEYDTPRFAEDSNHSSDNASYNAFREQTNPPPIPKKAM